MNRIKQWRRLAAVALSSLVAVTAILALNVSPASAAGEDDCRVTYDGGGWRVEDLCINSIAMICPDDNINHCYRGVTASVRLRGAPTRCSYFRVFIVDQNNVERFNTSKRKCSEEWPPLLQVWNGEFGGLRVKARFVGFDSDNGRISKMDSPLISSL